MRRSEELVLVVLTLLGSHVGKDAEEELETRTRKTSGKSRWQKRTLPRKGLGSTRSAMNQQRAAVRTLTAEACTVSPSFTGF